LDASFFSDQRDLLLKQKMSVSWVREYEWFSVNMEMRKLNCLGVVSLWDWFLVKK